MVERTLHILVLYLMLTFNNIESIQQYVRYNVALLPLVNHAFYKIVIFLGAGAVFHAVGNNCYLDYILD